MTKVVLKICTNTWSNASRDKRELSVCEELGCSTVVLAKGNPNDFGRDEIVDGFRVVRLSTTPLGVKWPKPLNRLASLFSWAKYAASIKPDIISGHDLIGLLIGWMARLRTHKKCQLVYDSHEFEIGRNKKRNKLQLFLVTRLERFLIKRCAFSIMVNDSIADEVQRIHCLKQRPIVVRSTPDQWQLDQQKIAIRRNSFLASLHDPKWLMMYHGSITHGRGIEAAIQLTASLQDAGLVIMGNAETETYLEELQALVASNHLDGRVLFHPAVPIDVLHEYVGAADVGLVFTESVCKSYYFSLPNKLFENIQSLTPVLATDLPEVKRIINKYQIGFTFTEGDLEGAKEKANQMMRDPSLYRSFKDHMQTAKSELCWEKEKIILIEAYQSLIP